MCSGEQEYSRDSTVEPSTPREPGVEIDIEGVSEVRKQLEARNVAVAREIRRLNPSGVPKSGAASAFALRSLENEIDNYSTLADQSKTEQASLRQSLVELDAIVETLERTLTERNSEADRLRRLLTECESSKLWRFSGRIAKLRPRRRSIGSDRRGG